MSIIANFLNFRLPDEIVKEIVSFLIPEISNIYFETRYTNSNYSSFSRKYEIAFLNEDKIMNPKIMNNGKWKMEKL